MAKTTKKTFVYEGRPKMPKSQLLIIEWKNNKETLPVILNEISKLKWCKVDHLNIYRFWKKEEKKEAYAKYGDAAFLDINISLPLDEKDNDAEVVIRTKDDRAISIGPNRAQFNDCFVIDKKSHDFYYADLSKLKEKYDLKKVKIDV